MFAYTLIVVVALVIVQYESVQSCVYSKQKTVMRRNGTSRVKTLRADARILVSLREFILFAVIATNAVMTVHDPGDLHIAIFNIAAVVLVVFVKLLWEWKYFTLHTHKYFLVIVATLLAVGSIVIFYKADEQYWLLHSFWHVGIALAIGVLFWAMDAIDPVIQCNLETGEKRNNAKALLRLCGRWSAAAPVAMPLGGIADV
jgi:hypothetical protein